MHGLCSLLFNDLVYSAAKLLGSAGLDNRRSVLMQKNHQVYETIGHGYLGRRQPDPRIAQQILRALGDAETVCNIGAGAGSYEPRDRSVTAVEPSQVMIDQRTSDAPVVRCTAENLPFSDNQFDAAMAILTLHHWQDPDKGLAEMKRISKRQIIFTFDTRVQDSHWLVADYLPEIIEFESGRALPIESIAKTLGSSRIETVPIPWNCTDGFQAAYWRRPEQYLRADVQASISTLALLPKELVTKAMNKLSDDINSGIWAKRYANLVNNEEMDFGYRLIISESHHT